MRLDAAGLSLVLSAISTLVVVVGAVAAVRQIRHLRAGNELEAIGKFVEEWGSESFTADRRFVMGELQETAARDAASLAALPNTDPVVIRTARVLNFFERLALLVRIGAVSEDLAMQLFGLAANTYWNALKGVIAVARAQRGSAGIGEYFEDFAMRVPDWQRRDERRRKDLRRDPSILSTAPANPDEGGPQAAP